MKPEEIDYQLQELNGRWDSCKPDDCSCKGTYLWGTGHHHTCKADKRILDERRELLNELRGL